MEARRKLKSGVVSRILRPECSPNSRGEHVSTPGRMPRTQARAAARVQCALLRRKQGGGRLHPSSGAPARPSPKTIMRAEGTQKHMKMVKSTSGRAAHQAPRPTPSSRSEEQQAGGHLPCAQLISSGGAHDLRRLSDTTGSADCPSPMSAHWPRHRTSTAMLHVGSGAHPCTCAQSLPLSHPGGGSNRQ